MNPIIIIGTGLAGYTLAREIRKHNTEIPLTLITADDGSYYSKPQLSSALTNKKTPAQLAMFSAEKMASQLNATIITHQWVQAINPSKQLVITADQQIPYSKLILACGAETIKPTLTGDAADSILQVNNLEEYRILRQKLEGKNKVAVIGCGLVGCELTNDLSNAGFNVAVIALSSVPLDTHVTAPIGEELEKTLAGQGVLWHLNEKVTAVNHNAQGYTITCASGLKVDAEVVLAAIGLRPNIKLAHAANLRTHRGIEVNRYLETSDPNIYAIGDCAEVEGLVLLYVNPLINSARALAQTLLGNRTAVHYPAMPIIIKTSSYPIIVCSPQLQNKWDYEMQGDSIKALFYDDKQQLQGFIVTKDYLPERTALVNQLPDLLK